MPERKVVAVHQPNFFPWLGYFHKIVTADIFIVLDNVQFSKKGGTWSNRVRLFVNRQPTWITLPVDRRYHGVRNINQVYIHNSQPWRKKLLRTIQLNYSQTPFFGIVFPFLADLINTPTDLLAEYNLVVIRSLLQRLNVDTAKLISGSTLNVGGKATDLLISLVKAVGGTTYLCGGGATGYQNDTKFIHAGLELTYQDFHHPIYPQIHTKDFSPGLSIIDTLMNCGFEKTITLLKAPDVALNRNKKQYED